jgi:hypothetical protein
MAIVPSPYPPEVDAHIWRGYREISGELKIGLMTEHGSRAPQWIASLLNLLIAETAVKLDVVYRLAGVPALKAKRDPVFRWLERQSGGVAAALRPVTISVKPACCFIDVMYDASAGLTPEMRARIASRHLDVLLWLGRGPLAGQASGLARFGVWAFSLGTPGMPASDPPYWREVVDGTQLSEIALLRHQETFDEAEVIASHRAPTQFQWRFTLNAAQPTWMGGPLLIRSFLDALSERSIEGQRVSVPHNPVQVSGPADTLRFTAQRTIHSLRARMRKTSGNKWRVGVRERRHEGANYVEIPKPEGSEYADPFVIEQRGGHYVFFEEVPAGALKGRISFLELLGDGKFGAPAVALETGRHMSYPVVFAANGELYMMPESGATLTVPLYRARRFPQEWEHVTNLVEGLPVVDTTPFYLDGVWYFFTGTKEPGLECLLFYADRLDGRWHYHPANPVSSDARRARPAGSLFYRDGRLFRPAQDCSVRYGYAIVLNEVLKLSKTEYQEREAETIQPSWRPGLLGTHTINANERYEVIDGLRREAGPNTGSPPQGSD